jgi:ATP-dependent DNA helicase RecG
VLGVRQAGPTDLRYARLGRDRRELAEARHVARRMMASDPRLRGPENLMLRRAVGRRFDAFPRLLDA